MGDAAQADALELREVISRIDRQLAETRKFVAKHDKLAAEQAKLVAGQFKFGAEQSRLYADTAKLTRDRLLSPWQTALAFLGAGAALFAAGRAFLRVIG